MGQALYRKYRSRALSEVVGQQHITRVLEQALAQNRITHAYLFTGPRGVGKTSIARIMAHDINKLPYSEDGHLDIVEIDAASNRRIDDIRELRDKVHIAPISAPYKTYIIDEVHMLTTESFNALLKTLEEPPAHVIFILATTEVQKLPATIISRTQRYHFRPVPEKDVAAHLKHIASRENIAIDDDALALIAQHGEGSFRDSISLLDQLGSLAGDDTVTTPYIETALGLAPHSHVHALAQATLDGTPDTVIALLAELEGSGVSPTIVTNQLMRTIKDLPHPPQQRFALIDALLDVPKSHNPQLKLLVVLTQCAFENTSHTPTHTPVRAAAAATEPTISAPVEELSAEHTDDTTEDREPANPEKPQEAGGDVTDFIWTDVTSAVTKQHAPLASILKHASMDFADGELTLYFPYELHRKKLESTKYRTQLKDTIVSLYGTCPKITTITGSPPPKSKVAASVAALMGGGQEVSLS